MAAGSLLVVAAGVTQATNDKQQIAPMLAELADFPDGLGHVEDLLADAGYFSGANVNACDAAGIEPVIATGRAAHHRSPEERHAPPPPAPENPTPLAAMRHRLKTPEGKKRYALRKQVVEPVFGMIKSVLEFRPGLLRRLDQVRGEWILVAMSSNIKRMFVLAAAN